MQLGITVEEDPGSKMEKILIKMLTKATNDKRGSIELFVYETDFGKIGKEYTGNFNEDTFKLWNSLKE